MRVQRVDVWQDCGKTETVLETNRYLLSHGHDNSAQVKSDQVVIVPPVNIHSTARIKNSVIGPFATIAAGCQVDDSIIQDSIVDEDAMVRSALLKQSLIGRDARLTGRFRTFNIGEASEVGFE
jgi:glucose-1-phosphate thymidylyltransferase